MRFVPASVLLLTLLVSSSAQSPEKLDLVTIGQIRDEKLPRKALPAPQTRTATTSEDR